MKRLFIFMLLVFTISLMAVLTESEGNNTWDMADVVIDADQFTTNFLGATADGSDVDWCRFGIISGDNVTVTIISGNVTVDIITAPDLVTDPEVGGTAIQTLVFSGTTTHNFTQADTDIYLKVTALEATAYNVYIENHDNATLPVELSSFSASVTSNNFVSLKWVTASESNLLGYSVYRSETNEVQSAIKVNASIINATNSTSTKNYEFEDSDVNVGKTYTYWLESLELDGTNQLHGPTMVTLTTPGSDDNDNPPVLFATAFKGASPNPFNPKTKLRYSLSQQSPVSFEIYNTKGQKVKTIYAGVKAAGEYSDVEWLGTDNTGNSVASGIYFIKMIAKNCTQMQKAILLK